MNSKSEIDRVQQVATTGTSWIICRSKTHKGRIYYFNTLSGEATWNLSKSEMEKARRSTKIPNQEDLNIIGPCPEPSESPTDQQRESPSSNTQNNVPCTSSNIPSSSTIYNKQIINNQFPKQRFPISPFIVPGMNMISNVGTNVVQNPVTMFPIAMNSSDTNVWTVTPQQQILFNPNLPLVNQGQPANVQFTTQCQPPVATVLFNNQGQCLNVPFHKQVPLGNMQFTNQGQPANVQYHSQDIPLSGQNTPTFSSSGYQRKGKNTSVRYTNKKKRGIGTCWGNGMQSNDVNSDKFDLRKVLSARKMQKDMYQADNNKESEREDCNSSAPLEEREEHDIILKESALSDPQTPQAGQVDVDEDWIEEHFFIKDGKIILDLTNLQNLATDYMDPHLWYIVADKDILLHHLNFLIIVCNSDEGCRLMVPQNVLTELQAAKEDPVNRMATRAKRAIVYILQHSDGQKIVIGDATIEESDTRCDYLLNCCANLLEEKYLVVLLSNDEDFKKLKDNSQIPVFNIREFKQFLSNPKLLNDKKKERLKPAPCLTKKHVEITFNNDLISEANEKGIYEPSDSIGTRCTLNQETLNQETQTEEKEIRDGLQALSMSNSSPKKVLTSVVQSDIAENNLVCLEEKLNSDDIQTTPSDNSKTMSNSTNQKRTIRLNRSISVKTPATAEETAVSKDEKKQYRWRKRRVAGGIYSNDCKTSSTVISNVKENETDICHTKEASNKYPEIREVMVSDESLINDSFKCNTTYEKVRIGETSTSEIISNSESEGGIQVAPLNLVFKQSQEPKKVMFEIEDHQMEHSLQVMNDEWLSRFWQIMDEVLTQILREDEKFLHETVYKRYGGGPWTILEAIDCVKIKFKYYGDVLEAANKLSNMISKISDSTDRIIVNIKPSVFMELYSYGVHLLAALRPALGSCEDLATASQSLLKLLNDIKNPNLDSSHNDTFSDRILPNTSYSDTYHIHVPHSPTIQRSPVAAPSLKKLPKDIQQRPQKSGAISTYNLRSRFNPRMKPRKETNTNQPVDISKPMNKQDSFFSSLNLVKKVPQSKKNNSPDSNASATCYQDLTASVLDKDHNTSVIQPSTSDGKMKAMGESKLSPETEKAVKNKKPVERVPLDMDQLDYDDEEYLPQNDPNLGRDEDVDDENCANEELPAITIAETNNNTFLTNFDSGTFEYNSPLNVNYHLNCIFGRLVGEVNESLVYITQFCEKLGKELSGPVYVKERKCELLNETKEVQAMIDDLCKLLYNIYAREAVEPHNNIQALLAEAGINDFDLNDDIFKLYREVVFKCFKEAKILQESLALLISVVHKKPITS